jgi:hypothetical protein
MSYPPGCPSENMNECWRSIRRLAKVIYNDPGNFSEDSIVLSIVKIGPRQTSNEQLTWCSARYLSGCDQWAQEFEQLFCRRVIGQSEVGVEFTVRRLACAKNRDGHVGSLEH